MYKMHFKCYNCGHQWHHMVEKGVRYYDVEKSGVSCIHEDVGHKKALTSYQRIVCPWCHTFSDIKNITSGQAPQNGYKGINTCVEEDDPIKIEEAKKEKKKQEQKVREMEEKKKEETK